MSHVLDIGMCTTHEISDITGNVMSHCLVNVHKM